MTHRQLHQYPRQEEYVANFEFAASQNTFESPLSFLHTPAVQKEIRNPITHSFFDLFCLSPQTMMFCLPKKVFWYLFPGHPAQAWWPGTAAASKSEVGGLALGSADRAG